MILVSEKCYEYTSVLSKIHEKIPGLAIFIATEIWPFKPVLLSQEA